MQGHFGTVYRGQLENEDNTVTTVAVKSFLPAEDPRLEADFIQEVKIMKMLNHPNIVKIIGFVEDPQINIIMEYVKHRSFIMYIHAHRPNLTNRRLLKFAADIALVSSVNKSVFWSLLIVLLISGYGILAK